MLESLNVKKNAQLIAYLCVGYVDKFYEESELKIVGWEREKILEECVIIPDKI
ncbi:Cobalamin biosynthesis protein BluB @ 5,6-dimethylbenzimidazole synthase, flavin destructase family [hydrothermal vent metagenome]|uniref:Cobalamin biosynthesis protein BluB @ 5,6-dimethylbenzimidazole synthase, flavin destructase family n=1 Tax=hydrothermal vent metagenome TaxID=652676 RepID=A0A1W1CLC2_9ZZZZ